MTKSELIVAIENKQPHLNQRDVELAINNIINVMTSALGDKAPALINNVFVLCHFNGH